MQLYSACKASCACSGTTCDAHALVWHGTQQVMLTARMTDALRLDALLDRLLWPWTDYAAFPKSCVQSIAQSSKFPIVTGAIGQHFISVHFCGASGILGLELWLNQRHSTWAYAYGFPATSCGIHCSAAKVSTRAIAARAAPARQLQT